MTNSQYSKIEGIVFEESGLKTHKDIPGKTDIKLEIRSELIQVGNPKLKANPGQYVSSLLIPCFREIVATLSKEIGSTDFRSTQSLV